MNRLTLIALCLSVFFLLLGTIFLSSTKIPAPSSSVERLLSNDRFPD